LQGFGYDGIITGADVAEHNPTPNFTVDLSAPALIYDQTSQKIAWSATQNVDCSLDENGAATAVVSSGNEKYLSIFAEYERDLSDPRTDYNGATVFFDRAESFQINVVQGVEAPTGTAVKPALRSDQVLLGDVLITYGMTQIQTSDIDDSRSQVPFDLTGSPLSIKEKSMQDVLQAMLDALNAFDSASISSSAISDSPSSLSSGTIFAQLTQLLGHVNDRGRLASSEVWTAKQTFSADPSIRIPPQSGVSLGLDGDIALESAGDDRLLVRIGSSNRIIAQTPIQRTVYVPITRGLPDWDASNSWHEWIAVQGATNFSWQSQDLDGTAYHIKFDLNGIVPQGAELNEVAIYVTPKGATSGTNGVRLGVFSKAPPPSSMTQYGSYAYDDGSDSTQWVEVTGLTQNFLSNQYMFFAQVRSQTFNATGYGNWLHYVRVKFTDGEFARMP
jgi:hypothetical protein